MDRILYPLRTQDRDHIVLRTKEPSHKTLPEIFSSGNEVERPGDGCSDQDGIQQGTRVIGHQQEGAAFWDMFGTNDLDTAKISPNRQSHQVFCQEVEHVNFALRVK